MFNSEFWWRNSLKHGAKLQNKLLRKFVKSQLRKGKWDTLPKKFYIVPDDGT
jgi:hypothetical protein